ncbi:hypothetical protein FRB90_011363 [Tulasnella sp. 427]|nr:hypothetical protein FRB90_011363 [Tulasnella sp. 427]
MTKPGLLKQGKLLPEEEIWAARFEFLKQWGYLLRPRYRPGWVAPWTLKPGLLSWEFEESLNITRESLIDARRLSDGKTVYLKNVPKDSPEIEIGKYFSTEELLRDPRNHCLPVLDVLNDPKDPENVIVVIPWLRRVDCPEPASVRECVDFVDQTLERWERLPNGKFPKGGDPSRTAVGGVRYYFIDFGISTQNQDEALGIDGQERSPELSDDIPYNPYKLDVYILGMAYRRFLFERYQGGLSFLIPLIQFMTSQNPSERPSAAEVLAEWRPMAAKLSFADLSQRLRTKEHPPESSIKRLIKDSGYRVADLWWTTTSTKRPPQPLP